MTALNAQGDLQGYYSGPLLSPAVEEYRFSPLYGTSSFSRSLLYFFPSVFRGGCYFQGGVFLFLFFLHPDGQLHMMGVCEW